MEPRWEEADDELREGYAVEHLLDQFIVTADYKKQTDCDWNVGTGLYLVACQGYVAEENSWEPYHISHDPIIEFERRSHETVLLLTAHAEDEPGMRLTTTI